MVRSEPRDEDRDPEAEPSLGTRLPRAPPVKLLDALGTARIARLEPAAARALVRAVETAERAVALYHRHRAGQPPMPHPIALTPFLVPRTMLPALGRLAALVHRLQVHAPALWQADAGGFRSLCPVSETTAAWLARPGATRAAPRQLMIRPDVGLEAQAGRPPRPVVFETNATALAGLYNHTAGVRILRETVFPRIYAPAQRAALEDPPDLLALTVRWVRGAARSRGLRRIRGVAFVETPGPVDGYSELPRMIAAFRAGGVPAVHGTPGELRCHRGQLRLRDVPVDLVYRDLSLDEVGPPGRRRAGGVAAALDAGGCLPGAAGEFSQKGLLEVLARPEVRRLFTGPERRLLAAAIPWTRVLGPRRTSDPAGREVDLPEFARRARERLLIKPNAGSSGTGVLVGRWCPAPRWEARIQRALADPGRWVVQAWRPGTRRPAAYLRRHRLRVGLVYYSLGLFYVPGELGLHCRVSGAPVVNVARQGALACAFLTRGSRAPGPPAA